MAVFLSPEWLSLLASSFDAVDPALDVVVEQVVTGGPGGDVCYRVELRDGKATVTDGGRRPNLSMRVAYLVAVALATGRTSVHDALQAGAVKLTGDLRSLQAVAVAVEAFGPTLAQVRDRTTYP